MLKKMVNCWALAFVLSPVSGFASTMASGCDCSGCACIDCPCDSCANCDCASCPEA